MKLDLLYSRIIFWLFATAIAGGVFLPLAALGEEELWDRPYVDPECATDYACRESDNNALVYELMYAGRVIPTNKGDMTKEECEKAKTAIQQVTGAFVELRCRPRVVARQKI